MSLLPGTFNARDLGGHPAAGGVVRTGLVIRSDAPVRLGEPGREVLRGLGIATAIDLREPVEVELDPPDFDGVGIEVVAAPMLGAEFGAMHDQSLAEIYEAMVRRRGDRFAAVLARLADDTTGPAIVFCSAGKDRTGLTSALLLAALGVEEPVIAADYHQTEVNMSGRFRDAIIARAIASGISDQEIATKVGAPLSLITGALALIRSEFGDTPAYLEAHGLGAETLERLRARLIEPV